MTGGRWAHFLSSNRHAINNRSGLSGLAPCCKVQWQTNVKGAFISVDARNARGCVASCVWRGGGGMRSTLEHRYPTQETYLHTYGEARHRSIEWTERPKQHNVRLKTLETLTLLPNRLGLPLPLTAHISRWCVYPQIPASRQGKRPHPAHVRIKNQT